MSFTQIHGAASRLLVAAVFACAACAAQAQVEVRSAAELSNALRSARGGEVIRLAPGDYGRLELAGHSRQPLSFPSKLTLRSANPEKPASFSGVDLNFVNNIVLADLDLRYTFKPSDSVRTKPFTVRNSGGVAIIDSRFIGDKASGVGDDANGFGTGIGLDVSGSSDIRVERNSFTTWHRGAVFHRSRDIIVRENIVNELRSDGMNFAQVNKVLIEGNRFGNFRTSLKTGDHPDMIQFWTNRTTEPSTDITIKDNILDIGDGAWTQSIFIRNEEVDNGRAGPEMFYKNIVITGNFIRNSHSHGITVGETDGLVIANNTLVQAAPAPRPLHVTVPGINIKAANRNVRIVDNVSPRFSDPAPGWTFENNLRVQRHFPRGPDFSGNYFVDGLVTGVAPLESFQFLPGVLSGKAVGSAYNRFDERPATPRLVIASAPLSAGRLAEQRMEVASAYGPSGPIDLAGAKAEWNFEDGAVKQGLSVTHRYAAGGIHRPTVVVTLRDGRKIAGARSILVE
jgi:Right handed beta helix region/PKD domain